MRYTLLATLLTILISVQAGCSSSNTPAAKSGQPAGSDLGFEVAGILRMYPGEFGNGPKKASDIKKYEAGFPIGYAAIQSGQIVVVWGATVAGEGGGGTADVVAYEKEAPTAGGMVVLQNGTVKQMTAEEFKAAPKAAK